MKSSEDATSIKNPPLTTRRSGAESVPQGLSYLKVRVLFLLGWVLTTSVSDTRDQTVKSDAY